MIKEMLRTEQVKKIIVRKYECDTQEEYRALRLQLEREGYYKIHSAYVANKIVATFRMG